MVQQSRDNATGDIFSLVGKDKYGFPLGRNPLSLTETKIDEIQEFKSEFTNFISQNSGLKHDRDWETKWISS